MARLDVFERIRLVSSAEVPADAKDFTSDLLARTIVVVDERGRRTTRADAVAAMLRALPLGLLWSLPLRIPGLRQLADWGYDAFARNRQTISIWLGLAACGVPGAKPSPAAAPPPPRAPVIDWLGRLVAILREGFTLAMLITVVNETLLINQAVPQVLKFDEPRWVKQLVAYPRFIQAWSMFASDAPTTDESMAVDAVTADGRHVDPYSEVAGRYPYPGTEEIPSRLDNDSFFFNYSVRIPIKACTTAPSSSGSFTTRSAPTTPVTESSGSTPTRSRTTARRRARPYPATFENTSSCRGRSTANPSTLRARQLRMGHHGEQLR